MADAGDLKSPACNGRVGSNPTSATEFDVGGTATPATWFGPAHHRSLGPGLAVFSWAGSPCHSAGEA